MQRAQRGGRGQRGGEGILDVYRKVKGGRGSSKPQGGGGIRDLYRKDRRIFRGLVDHVITPLGKHMNEQAII